MRRRVDFEMVSSSCANVSHTRRDSTPNDRKLIAFCFHLIVPLHSMRCARRRHTAVDDTIDFCHGTNKFISSALHLRRSRFRTITFFLFLCLFPFSLSLHIEVSRHFAPSRTHPDRTDTIASTDRNRKKKTEHKFFTRSKTSKLLIVLSFAPKKFSILKPILSVSSLIRFSHEIFIVFNVIKNLCSSAIRCQRTISHA